MRVVKEECLLIGTRAHKNVDVTRTCYGLRCDKEPVNTNQFHHDSINERHDFYPLNVFDIARDSVAFVNMKNVRS